MLLKQGADPNVKDNAGWTPLVSVFQVRICMAMYVRMRALHNTYIDNHNSHIQEWRLN